MSRFVQAPVQLDGLASGLLRFGKAGLIEVDASLVVEDVGNFWTLDARCLRLRQGLVGHLLGLVETPRRGKNKLQHGFDSATL